MKYALANDTWDNLELDAIDEVIASGRYTMGPKVFKFEKEFAAYHDAKYAVMVNSGSSANLLMVAALVLSENYDLNPGDEVIVPAVSWSTTYFPLQQYGLKCIFVDIDPDTLNYNLDQLLEAMKRKTVKAIMAVSLLGNHHGITMDINDPDKLILMEDNCESLGATINRPKNSKEGVLRTYSFFFSHHMQTMEGGMILTDDKELYQMLQSLRAHGWLRELPVDNHVCNKLNDPFYDSFRFALPGYSVRPLEMSGAIGSVQLKKLPGFLLGRRVNAKVFQSVFGDKSWCRIQQETGESSWFGFAIILEGPLLGCRDDVVKILTQAGVECRPIVAGNFTRNPVIKFIDHEIHGTLDAADDIHDNGFFIGNGHEPLAQELFDVHEIIQNYINEYRGTLCHAI